MLDPNRFFDSDPIVRQTARELYDGVKDLPLVCPHGHTDPRWFAENEPFSDPVKLIIIPDHYVFRMLYSRGISMEALGIPSRDDTAVENDRRKIWQIFADHFYLFAGTPTGVWMTHVFVEVFGINEKFNSVNAMAFYDHIEALLKTPQFFPRALFDRFNIEVLSTTDEAAHTLEYHRAIADSGWNGRVIPCFRPDAVINILNEEWADEIIRLGECTQSDITSYSKYIQALENRRDFFKSMGAVSTDHAVDEPFTQRLSNVHADELFIRALSGKAGREDARLFTAHMLMEMARMSVEDGMVMQIHPGVYRNHNEYIYRRYGKDKGCDIPVRTEYTRNLRALLNAYGNDPRLTLIVFTLDESAYTRELAPLAGHYPSMRLGPAWWFNDSIQGMTRFRERVTETAGIYNTAGFNDDTRAFMSIPARHDLSRRIDSNFLAGLTARHIIDLDQARMMSRALAYDLVKETYKLNNPINK